jgi:hypothetical protein
LVAKALSQQLRRRAEKRDRRMISGVDLLVAVRYIHAVTFCIILTTLGFGRLFANSLLTNNLSRRQNVDYRHEKKDWRAF